MVGWGQRKAGIFMLLIVMLMAAACGTNTGTGNGGNVTGERAEQGQEGASGTNAGSKEGGKRVVKHAMGETTIEGTPQRIATLYQGANDTAVALGVTPVAIVESWTEKPVYPYLKEQLSGIPLLGEEHQPNLEELQKQKPDLIVATKTRHEAIYDQLSQIAPTVMIDQVYEWQSTLSLMGEALGKQTEADQLLKGWQDRVTDFKAKMGDRLPAEATITNFRADHARIFYMGFAGLVLKEAGFGRPPGHDENTWGVKLTSKESIQDMNADIIFNFNTDGDQDAVKKFYEEWTSHPLWKNLDAVKNNQVFQVEEIAWNTGGGVLAANNMLDQMYKFFELEP